MYVALRKRRKIRLKVLEDNVLRRILEPERVGKWEAPERETWRKIDVNCRIQAAEHLARYFWVAACRLIINPAIANGVVNTDDENSTKCLSFHFLLIFFFLVLIISYPKKWSGNAIHYFTSVASKWTLHVSRINKLLYYFCV